MMAVMVLLMKVMVVMAVVMVDVVGEVEEVVLVASSKKVLIHKGFIVLVTDILEIVKNLLTEHQLVLGHFAVGFLRGEVLLFELRVEAVADHFLCAVWELDCG